jgi:aerobic carbon-monoxide dehydrogenase small subunit
VRRAITLTLNGEPRTLEVDARTVLVDLVREHCDLTGTHVGCRTGHCGACTVLLDGRTAKSCCVLALDVDGHAVETVESLAAAPGELHPIQEAFVRNQGLQCGYCTPGMLLSVKALLAENPAPTEREVREGIAGNLCRCTGYQNIVASVLAAAETQAQDPSS